MSVTMIGDADVLEWLKAAAEDPTMRRWQFAVETAINDIERYRADISAIRSGSITLIPSSVAHAEAMLLIAERYLNDRRK